MTEQTPSQAEGEPERDEAETSGENAAPRTTPSQAEGDRDDDGDATDAQEGDGSRS
ncbi:hypothetical protein [Streptomyces sp. NPDC006610]|jgi:hypothetical protein|uniref:hypothetical protein n=1 Tax=Streptomyces sp. NPDC006610 TaxID=3154584 RepID=UPI0033AE9919